MTTKICKYCGNCKTLYDCGRYRLFRLKKYYCALREEIIDRENSCGEWCKRKVEYELSPQRFDEAEADLKKIFELISPLGIE